ncbi:hypothetical protein ATZ36_13760 [Candidatus Endomicrobiellum trichonymphae]|uniref:Uncharacterized protein n=1 Tax=Endomicrobium trichonymphae TaxID=1408204 RepID=A0A1E5IMA3_ENDTX|nr:hypothetical protein ATZ36_13760 [Candidatus Endomicrobium trichonymphae]
MVVIDIDMHSNEYEKDGIENWLKTEAKLNLPMDCKFENHTCCVHTPSDGFHLYYRTEETLEFKKDLTTAVDIPKVVNVAGSVRTHGLFYIHIYA